MAELNESRDAATPAPAQPEAARSGIAGWITGVFMDPGTTFQGIADSVERPHPTDPAKTKDMSKWWLPVVLFIVVTAAITLYSYPTFVAPMQADAVREQVMERGGSEADVEMALKMSTGPVALVIGIVVMIILVGVFFFVAAAIAHGVMKMLGGKGRYRHARAVMGWTMLIAALGSLVKLPIMIAKKSAIVETGPSLFFKDLEPSDTLFKFLANFDIFTIWAMVVTVVALAVVYRTSYGKSAIAVAVLWILQILLITYVVPGGMGAGM